MLILFICQSSLWAARTQKILTVWRYQ